LVARGEGELDVGHGQKHYSEYGVKRCARDKQQAHGGSMMGAGRARRLNTLGESRIDVFHFKLSKWVCGRVVVTAKVAR
jgi:hypothetical protein